MKIYNQIINIVTFPPALSWQNPRGVFTPCWGQLLASLHLHFPARALRSCLPTEFTLQKKSSRNKARELS